jgi:hypothetical protein
MVNVVKMGSFPKTVLLLEPEMSQEAMPDEYGWSFLLVIRFLASNFFSDKPGWERALS